MSKLKEIRWDQECMAHCYFDKEQCLAFVRSMGLDVQVDYHGNPILNRLDEDDEESGVDPVQHIVFQKKYWPKWQVQWWVSEQLEKTGLNVIRLRLHGEDEKGYKLLSKKLYTFLGEQGVRALNINYEYGESPDNAIELDDDAEAFQNAVVVFEHRAGKNGEVIADKVLREARIALDYFAAPKYVLDQIEAAERGMSLPRESILPIDTVGVPEEDLVLVHLGRVKDEDYIEYNGRKIGICPKPANYPIHPSSGIPIVYCNKHGNLGIDQEKSFLGEHWVYTHQINENGNPYTGYQMRMSIGFSTKLEYLKEAFYFFVKNDKGRHPYGDDLEAAWLASMPSVNNNQGW